MPGLVFSPQPPLVPNLFPEINSFKAAYQTFPKFLDLCFHYPKDDGSTEIWKIPKILDYFQQKVISKLRLHTSLTSTFGKNITEYFRLAK